MSLSGRPARSGLSLRLALFGVVTGSTSAGPALFAAASIGSVAGLAVGFPPSDLRADIRDCGGVLTNRECPGGDVMMHEKPHEPPTRNELDARAKDRLVESLEFAALRARRRHGLDPDVSTVREACRTATVAECRSAVLSRQREISEQIVASVSRTTPPERDGGQREGSSGDGGNVAVTVVQDRRGFIGGRPFGRGFGGGYRRRPDDRYGRPRPPPGHHHPGYADDRRPLRPNEVLPPLDQPVYPPRGPSSQGDGFPGHTRPQGPSWYPPPDIPPGFGRPDDGGRPAPFRGAVGQ